MNELPTYLVQLRANGRLAESQLPRSARNLLEPLFVSGILVIEKAGRGEVVRVINQDAFDTWLPVHFPNHARQLILPDGSHRARAVALRRDSKSTGRGVNRSVLHLRSFGNGETDLTIDGEVLAVDQLSQRYGIVACLIHDESVIDMKRGVTLLVENLESFLQAESMVPTATLALHSAGRVSDRLLACLARSDLGESSILHLPDYDPVGLSDYLRLHSAVGDRVSLYVPDDLERRFEKFGNRDLIRKKRRNRELLERLGGSHWPCPESLRVFDLIKESGSALEQEALLIQERIIARTGSILES